MIPALTGYTLRVIGVANTSEELNNFVVQEASLPRFSRIIVEVHVDPTEDISSIAQQVQEACAADNVPYWPEYQGNYVFTEGDTLYITYVTPSGTVSPSIAWMLIIGIIAVIAPIIMIFAIPGLKEIIDALIMLAVMWLMMSMMRPLFESMGAGPKTAAVRGAPGEQPLPFEQRVSRKIDSIADSIVRVEGAFEKSKSAGLAAVSSVVSDITRLGRAIKGAPSTSMTSYQKAKATRELDILDNRLERYKENLTPSQREDLEEEQRIVEEMRSMYD